MGDIVLYRFEERRLVRWEAEARKEEDKEELLDDEEVKLDVFC
jgi:hypothetical protein